MENKEELTRLALEREASRKTRPTGTLEELREQVRLLEEQKRAEIPATAVMREDFIEWLAMQVTLFDNHWRNESLQRPTDYPEHLDSNEEWLEQFDCWLELKYGFQ